MCICLPGQLLTFLIQQQQVVDRDETKITIDLEDLAKVSQGCLLVTYSIFMVLIQIYAPSMRTRIFALFET
jgi:uncharacterized protein HemY